MIEYGLIFFESNQIKKRLYYGMWILIECLHHREID